MWRYTDLIKGFTTSPHFLLNTVRWGRCSMTPLCTVIGGVMYIFIILSMSDFLLCSMDPSTKLQSSVSTNERRVIPESKAFMAGARGEQRQEHRSQRLVEYVKYKTFSGYLTACRIWLHDTVKLYSMHKFGIFHFLFNQLLCVTVSTPTS